MCNAIIDKTMGTLLEYRQLIKQEKYKDVWVNSFANESGRLAQGIRDVNGTNTIYFIPCSTVPHGCTVTYGRIVVDYQPQKLEPSRTRLTFDSN